MPLRGQLGAFSLHAEVLTAEALKRIWSDGADHDLGAGDEIAENSPRCASLILHVSPRSRDANRRFVNNALGVFGADGRESGRESSRDGRDRAARPSAPASLGPGTHACVTQVYPPPSLLTYPPTDWLTHSPQTARDSARCLGGVQLLLPLLARLPRSVVCGPPPSTLLVQLIGLIAQTLCDSPADQVDRLIAA